MPSFFRSPRLAAVLLAALTGGLPLNASGQRDSGYIVSEIILAGNKVTKDYILLRELTFQVGDTLTAADSTFKRSEENLLNTSLFHKADITWLTEGNRIRVFIIVFERWYIFPVPMLEIADRNFNEWWKTKDLSRLNYGAYLYWNNFRGRNETVTLALRFGYTQRFSLYYEIPFINRRMRSGLIFSAGFSQNREVAYATNFDQLNYVEAADGNIKEEQAYSVQYTMRPKLDETHTLEAGYRHVEVLDTVLRRNPSFLADGRTSEKFFILRYAYKMDHRDIKIYPLHGWYADFEAVKNGFSFLDDDVDITFLLASARAYQQLGRKWYAALELKGKYSGTATQPYYNTRGLGYSRDYVRGYEYYVVDGQRFGLGKMNLKYELLAKRYLHANFLPEKFAHIPYAFYLNLYGDGGYVKDNQFAAQHNNELPNSWVFGYGAGIDFVSYYDIVLRIEYSFNKFGESGIFLHFTASI